MGKVLVILGLIIAGIGLLIMAGAPIGRLPGDLTWRRGNTTIYIPLATSIIISIVLTIVLALLRR
jgi:uncharacterized membrane protein YidH (DUF202 family)